MKASPVSEFKRRWGTFLVAPWLTIGLPVQGTWVRTGLGGFHHRTTKPVHHGYWACALEPASCTYWAREPHPLKPKGLEPGLYKRSRPRRSLRSATKSSLCSRQLKKVCTKQWGPSAAKNKKFKEANHKLNDLYLIY